MKIGTRLFLYSAFDRIPPQIVEFQGIQRVGFDGIPDFGIYELTVAVGKYPAGATLARIQLEEELGYVLPSVAP